jgi:hypothetical protein
MSFKSFHFPFSKNEKSQEQQGFLLSQNIIYNTMAKEFNVLIERGQDGYLISEVIELPGCHTQAKTFDVTYRKNTRSYLTIS